MKIEGNRPNIDATQTDRTDAASAPHKVGTKHGAKHVASTGAKTDHVEVSSTVQFAQAAMAAATAASDVRPDAVERGRKLLESGTLGADANKLADALIDQTLKK